MKNILFCDAAFNPHNPKWKDSKFVEGQICITDGKDFMVVETVAVGRVDGLKQYNNVLELTACARAIELAFQHKMDGGLRIQTDSRTAAAWAFSGVNKKIATSAHFAAEEYFKNMKKVYHGEIFVGVVPREENPAGHKLEALQGK